MLVGRQAFDVFRRNDVLIARCETCLHAAVATGTAHLGHRKRANAIRSSAAPTMAARRQCEGAPNDRRANLDRQLAA